MHRRGKYSLKLIQSFLSEHELAKIFLKYATACSPCARASDLAGFEPEFHNARERSSEILINVVPPHAHENGAIPTQIPTSDLTLSLENFTSFLLSAENSIFADQHGNVWQDMTHSLTDYYISSSHNTYLVGSQWIGASTIEGYIRALLRGCRSVECRVFILN